MAVAHTFAHIEQHSHMPSYSERAAQDPEAHPLGSKRLPNTTGTLQTANFQGNTRPQEGHNVALGTLCVSWHKICPYFSGSGVGEPRLGSGFHIV
jgi:hypothetical protein